MRKRKRHTFVSRWARRLAQEQGFFRFFDKEFNDHKGMCDTVRAGLRVLHARPYHYSRGAALGYRFVQISWQSAVRDANGRFQQRGAVA